MTESPLETDVQFVPGVGPQRAELLRKLGLHVVQDLLFYLPRDVLDLTRVTPVDQLEEGAVQQVRGTVVDLDGRTLSTGKTLSAVLLDCDSGYVRGVWFNQNWILQKFQPGQTVLFSGKPKRHGGRWEFSHPRIQWLEDDDSTAHGGVLPRYGLTEGLKMHELRRIMRSAVERYAQEIPEHLPPEFLEENSLPDLRSAVRQLHLPHSMEEYEAGKRRVIFDDLLEFQLGLAMRRRAWKKIDRAPRLPTTAKIDARIRRLFPFTFTRGQDQAVREISADLASGRAMHRLLQADVGAGKTAVALYAMLVAVANGRQVVLMAPTEVLALQHWDTVDQALWHSRVRRLLLTGQLTPAQRKQALAKIAAGEVDLVVGTQAVIQKDVAFARLGLVVIDEQHKFGVMQRASFTGESESPHVLVMTATPIPRSLCLTQFGDLDLSTITELPPGRQPIVTHRVWTEHQRQRAWNFLRKQMQAGRQLYVVCPRVEGDSQHDAAEGDAVPLIATDAGSAEDMFRSLRQTELKGFSVGLVHGQMDRQQRGRTMDDFREGRLQALVATTVIEVGIDVPNATLMVIQKAESFGLLQLHQLRGRIGRGKFQGYCFLFSESDSPDAIRRLQALEATTDGFKIAEADFELRGPGDVLGTRQHGQLPLRVADLNRDSDLLLQVREKAFDLVESGRLDTPAFVPLKVRVLERFRKLMDLPQSG